MAIGETIEEGVKLHDRRRDALKQRRVAEGRHLDRRETLGRRVVHRAHGAQEDVAVCVARGLARVRILACPPRTAPTTMREPYGGQPWQRAEARSKVFGSMGDSLRAGWLTSLASTLSIAASAA